MSQLVDHHEPLPRSARLWTLLRAFGYAGALVDPTGVLATQRLRRAEEKEPRHGRRGYGQNLRPVA